MSIANLKELDWKLTDSYCVFICSQMRPKVCILVDISGYIRFVTQKNFDKMIIGLDARVSTMKEVVSVSLPVAFTNLL